MNSVLRPLSLGEILDQTAQLYRRNFLRFAGVAIIPTAVMFAIAIVIGLAAGFPVIQSAAKNTPVNPAASGMFFLVMLIASPLLLVPLVFSQAGVTRAAVSAFRGTKLKVREALTGVKPRFWRYLGLMVLQGLMIVGIPGACAGIVIGAMFLIPGVAGKGGGAAAVTAGLMVVLLILGAVVLAVFLATEFGMGLAACVVEDKPAWDALKRARKLSKGTRGRIFVMFLVVWCMMMVLSMVGYIPSVILIAVVSAVGRGSQYAVVAVVLAEAFNLLVNFSLQILISPAYLVALVLFYFDQRVRLEGYDIEWMMEQAGLNAPVAAPALDAAAGYIAPEATAAPAQEQ